MMTCPLELVFSTIAPQLFPLYNLASFSSHSSITSSLGTDHSIIKLFLKNPTGHPLIYSAQAHGWRTPLYWQLWLGSWSDSSRSILICKRVDHHGCTVPSSRCLLCSSAVVHICIALQLRPYRLRGCSDIGVDGQGYQTAVCRDGNGGQVLAALDLDAHISNSKGNLVDGGGAGFAASCSNIRWYQLGTDNQGVAAECTKEDGSKGSTTL